MKRRQTLEKELKKVLETCFLLSVEDKNSFLQKIPNMPDFLLEKAIFMIGGKNKIAESYLDAGLALDSGRNYLKQFNVQSKKDKAKAKTIYEKSNSDQADQNLQNQLEKINE